MKQVYNFLDFPILWISNLDDAIGVYHSIEELTTMVKGGETYLTSKKIISADGKEFKVKDVHRVKKVGYFSGLWLFQFFGMYKVKVNINFFPESIEVSTENLKKELKKIFDRDITLWDSDGRFEELSILLKEADNVRQINQIMERRCFGKPF